MSQRQLLTRGLDRQGRSRRGPGVEGLGTRRTKDGHHGVSRHLERGAALREDRGHCGRKQGVEKDKHLACGP